ncbi:MAG: type II toxin-antitoxin system VapC family toxin, partial [Pyrinomonadaceae bacterium]
IITSSLSLVEVYSVLNRRRRELSLSAVDYSQITSGFKNICTAEYQIIEFLLPVSDRARLLLETYPLRAGDAIQLSSALIANATLQQNQFSSLIFLASDARLVNAAKAEGLAVDDPLLHS